MAIISAIIFSLANGCRGGGQIKKVLVYAISCSIWCLYLSFYTADFWKYGLVIFFTNWLCYSWGWGKFFPHGRNTSKEREFLPATAIADSLWGHQDNLSIRLLRYWQATAMSMRFFLTFGLIKVPLLAYLLESPQFLGAASLYLFVGAIYYYFFKNEDEYSVRKSELAVGLLQGFINGSIIFYV